MSSSCICSQSNRSITKYVGNYGVSIRTSFGSDKYLVRLNITAVYHDDVRYKIPVVVAVVGYSKITTDVRAYLQSAYKTILPCPKTPPTADQDKLRENQ